MQVCHHAVLQDPFLQMSLKIFVGQIHFFLSQPMAQLLPFHHGCGAPLLCWDAGKRKVTSPELPVFARGRPKVVIRHQPHVPCGGANDVLTLDLQTQTAQGNHSCKTSGTCNEMNPIHRYDCTTQPTRGNPRTTARGCSNTQLQPSSVKMKR